MELPRRDFGDDVEVWLDVLTVCFELACDLEMEK